jgi:transcription initiation factor TFIIIB Brf1 subunit/transcription initiation factor TFIIB
MGSEVSPSTPEAYVQAFASEIELTGRMMKSAKILPL